MNIKRTKIDDVLIIEPSVIKDNRGYFFESYKQKNLEDFIGYKINFCQDNESKSSFGVLRGLHYQIPPFAQTKLVRVIEGEVLDVVVDIRKDSPTFGKHVSVILSDKNKKQLFIPIGFAHGFIVLSKYAIFSYKVDNYYSKDHDRGLLYNSGKLKIDWLIDNDNICLSYKDSIQPDFSDIEYFD
jgi:dTDP-4-dehydrorhamnose 3,5-epimerase